MRQFCGWLVIVLFACACDSNRVPFGPTAMPTPAPAATSPPAYTGYTGGNWKFYSFNPWQPAVGPALALNTTVNAIVDVGELCVPDIYRQWGARACERFVVTVPTDGWLHASLKWDPSAPGFDLGLVGEVVLVASTGQFASSDWHKAVVDIRAPVVPGVYDLLVLAYSQQVALPFQLGTELQAN